MTTTLRPAGPLLATDTGRSRSYDVCVNGRRTGGITLSCTDGTGCVEHLGIEPPDRRRGRATVAVLAAEEVLRGWGCTSAVAAVPAGDDAALALAGALGYAESNRNLVKSPLEAHPLPEGTSARPMRPDEYARWRQADAERMLAQLLDQGLDQRAAARRLDTSLARVLPDGRGTEGTVLRTLTHDGEAVGILWLDLVRSPRPEADAWVYSVEVEPPARGRGFGRALMHLAEHECRSAGAERLGLNVLTANTPARRLYESLGYRPVALHLRKALG